ncbi:hypothetical protein BC567DRAFT_90316 [Phyllosticta citribraziliensis]
MRLLLVKSFPKRPLSVGGTHYSENDPSMNQKAVHGCICGPRMRTSAWRAQRFPVPGESHMFSVELLGQLCPGFSRTVSYYRLSYYLFFLTCPMLHPLLLHTIARLFSVTVCGPTETNQESNGGIYDMSRDPRHIYFRLLRSSLSSRFFFICCRHG